MSRVMEQSILNDFATHFRYDAISGVLTRLITRNQGRYVGEEVGFVKKDNLWMQFKGKAYAVHNVCWYLHYGEWPHLTVDHINCNAVDNRITNLRLATAAQNNANRRRSSKYRVGLKGTTFHKKSCKWRSMIACNKKRIYLGDYDSEQEAHEAYVEAAFWVHGDFRNIGYMPCIKD